MPRKARRASAAAVTDGIVAALRRVFRPLARLLIARSIPFPLASSLLRHAYVEVAVDEFPVPGKAQTDSRITLLTGVHRKDVKRLRTERHTAARLSHAGSLGTQLIARWMSLTEYCDVDGNPLPLRRTGGAPSFESLVRSLSTDIRPRAILDEWLRLGLVEIDAQDRVALNVQAFIPAQDSEEMFYFFGRNLHDHAAAAVHNVLGLAPTFLERSVNYNNLSEAAVKELTELARTKGTALLRELNARALRLQQRDAGKPDASHRVNVGVYVFAQNEDDAEDDE